jgi:hypothetical protein
MKSLLITLVEEVEEVTFRITLAECASEPLVPVMVRVGLPTGVLEFIAIVSVELVPAAIEVGLNRHTVYKKDLTTGIPGHALLERAAVEVRPAVRPHPTTAPRRILAR